MIDVCTLLCGVFIILIIVLFIAVIYRLVRKKESTVIYQYQPPYQQPYSNLPPSAPIKQCKNCGDQIPYNDDFCPTCGAKQH